MDFAKSAGAREQADRPSARWRRIGTGQKIWLLPDGVQLVFSLRIVPNCNLPNTFWEFVDEPLVNTYFKTIQISKSLSVNAASPLPASAK